MNESMLQVEIHPGVAFQSLVDSLIGLSTEGPKVKLKPIAGTNPMVTHFCFEGPNLSNDNDD